ncbi:MAG: hypothetical protein AAB676_01930, partial [Verrucomicrobiota bacterium]
MWQALFSIHSLKCKAFVVRPYALRRAVDKVDQHAESASGQNVAQVSNLLYRRFPIGSASDVRERVWNRGVRRLEALRHSRLGNLYSFSGVVHRLGKRFY